MSKKREPQPWHQNLQKSSLKQVIDLAAELKHKTSTRTHWRNLSNFGFSLTKEKIYLLHFIKTKSICSSKDTKIGSSQPRRKHLQIYLTKDFILSPVYKELWQPSTSQTHKSSWSFKDRNETLQQIRCKMAHKHMERHSTLLVMRAGHMKTTLFEKITNSHYWLKLKRLITSHVGEGVETGTLRCCHRGNVRSWPLGKHLVVSLKLKTHRPCEPSILLLGICLRER